MDKKGSVYLYTAFAGLLILSIGLGWFYLRDRAAFGGLNLPFISGRTEMINTKDWKSFQIADNLTVLYPPDWFIFENKYISQYPYTPGKVSNDIYNAINATAIESQIQPGYANEDWFNRLYNAKKGDNVVNGFRPSGQNQFIAVDSGKTLSGKRFVLFRESKEPRQTQAYLYISSLAIYQFTLNNFDQTGLEYFKKIISTSSDTTPNP